MALDHERLAEAMKPLLEEHMPTDIGVDMLSFAKAIAKAVVDEIVENAVVTTEVSLGFTCKPDGTPNTASGTETGGIE